MTALLIVDIQNDFLPGGALSVPNGDVVIPVINRLLELDFDFVVATKDWHPKNHGSFASNHGKFVGDYILLEGLDQILWPDHCVENTKGSEFSEDLNLELIDHITHKGMDQSIDSYSAFFDNGHKKSTGLEKKLKEMGIINLYVCGLATDYCVKFSTLDACRLGFNTYVIEDACRGVNLSGDDSENAVTEMRKSGAQIINSADVVSPC
jgi:nicotinamidase/pyrazinamidase